MREFQSLRRRVARAAVWIWKRRREYSAGADSEETSSAVKENAVQDEAETSSEPEEPEQQESEEVPEPARESKEQQPGVEEPEKEPDTQN